MPITLPLKARLIRLKLLFFVLFYSVFIPAFNQSVESKVITLDDAVNMTLSNNPAAKNAALNVEAAKTRKSGSFWLQPTNIEWDHGQIFSPINDNRLVISQNFGSPITHIQRDRLNRNGIEISEINQKIEQKHLIALVKEAYFRWVYQIAINKLYEQELNLYEDFIHIEKPQMEQEEKLLEKTMAEMRYSEAQRKFLISQEQIKIAVNYLDRYVYSEEPFEPAQKELDLYSIKFPEGQEDKFYPYTFKDYLQKQVVQNKLKLSMEKSYLFPEISAGYFHQSINPVKNLQGFQIGLSIPLWFVPQNSKIKEARINKDIATNAATLQTYELEQTIDDLKIRLDQGFINVVYFREDALNQADLLLKTAILKIQGEEAEYLKYFQSISEALKIKEEYLTTILNYNLTAIELEYYLN